MIDYEEEMHDIQEAQQVPPKKVLTQKEIKTTLIKIAPMLVILKEEDLSDESIEEKEERKKQAVINALIENKPEGVLISDYLVELAYDLESLNETRKSFSKKVPKKVQCIIVIITLITLLIMAISVIMKKCFDGEGHVVFLLAGLLMLSMCIIACVSLSLMTLGCTPRSLYLNVFANEEAAVNNTLNQVFVAPSSTAKEEETKILEGSLTPTLKEDEVRTLESSLNIEEMNALLTIINNYLQSLNAPINSAGTDLKNESASVNPVKVSTSKYGTFPPVPKVVVKFHLDSNASLFPL